MLLAMNKRNEHLKLRMLLHINVLISGPPGCGKSLLAKNFHSILPPLTNQAQLEVMSLYQLAGERQIIHQNATYRHPHHSAS